MTVTKFLTGSNPYERRISRSIAFVDLSGFTAYTDRNGDDAAVGVLSQFRAALREVGAHHGIRIAKWLGDGAMLVGVHDEEIAEALVDLQQLFARLEAPLPLRAGLASGPVILFEGDDYIGNSVNLASRLCDLAKPGQVLAPLTFLSSLMVNTEGTFVGEFDIPGFTHPIEVVELSSAPSDHDVPGPTDSRGVRGSAHDQRAQDPTKGVRTGTGR